MGTGYLIGSVIYLYTCSLFEVLRTKKILYALSPFLLQLIAVNIPFMLSNPVDGYLFDYLKYMERYGNEIYLFELFVFCLFTIKSFKKYKQQGKHLASYYSDIDKNDVNWIKQMLGGILLFIIINFVWTIYLIVSDKQNFLDIYISSLSAAFITFYITYHGLYQAKIFIPKHFLEAKSHPKKKKSETYGYVFSEAITAEFKSKLEHVLGERKLYLNPSITLSDLAKEMHIPEKKLSGFINQKLQTSYYELINHYRLNEFKKQIQDAKNKIFALMAVANQCGFKSKTSFYSYFKNHTGMTPSQFVKEVTNSPA